MKNEKTSFNGLKRCFTFIFACSVCLGSFCLFSPKKQISGITANADTMLPTTSNISSLSDLYAYDYMTIFVGDNSSPKSIIYGSPNYFFDPNSSSDYRDGFVFGQGSNTQMTWTRQYTINTNQHLVSSSLTFNNGGSFQYVGSSSAFLNSVTAPISLTDGAGIGYQLFYESLVIPKGWIGNSSTPTIRTALGLSSRLENVYFIGVDISCTIYSDVGLQQVYNNYSLMDIEGNSPNYEFRIFPAEIFDGLQGDLFWIKDYTIEFLAPTYFDNTAVQADRFIIGYKSWVDNPSKSFADASLSYVEQARIVDFSANPIERDYLDWLVSATQGFFEAEIFPGFSLGGILGIIVAIRCMLWILKMMAGG